MGTLQRELRGEILVLRLAKPRANAIDDELVQDLLDAVAAANEDPAVRSILLASAHPRVFCPGLDLKYLLGLDRFELTGFMARFTQLVRALYGCEKPVAAAVAGHAVAGGCILALTADLRIIAGNGVYIGLNEGRAGLPLPWTVTVLLRNVLGREHLTEVALLGRNFSGSEAVTVGLADEVYEAEDFEAHCLERLTGFATQEPVSFALTKSLFRHEALERMRRDEPQHLSSFVDAAMHPAVRRRIEATLEGLTGSD